MSLTLMKTEVVQISRLDLCLSDVSREKRWSQETPEVVPLLQLLGRSPSPITRKGGAED